MQTSRRISTLFIPGIGLVVLVLFGLLLLPDLHLRVKKAETWVRGVTSPAGELPTAATAEPAEGEALWLPDLLRVEAAQSEDGTPISPMQGMEVLPDSVALTSPAFDPARDYQDWNNCGPATLALALRYWGWQGDQFNISKMIKPEEVDQNVTVEELVWFVEHETENLQAEIRVGGDLSRLKQFLSAGFPVVLEKTIKLEKSAWPGDDLWAGHFLLLTGYDDRTASFTVQDSYYGPDRVISYDVLDKEWQAFNNVYLVVFPKNRLGQVQTVFGPDWRETNNLDRTVQSLQTSLNSNQENAHAWFNLGSTYVRLMEYSHAAEAFAKARQLGLPQRMLRYQFGPFVAAYETGNLRDLTMLTDYALKITPDSEEALFWKGHLYLLEDNPKSAENMFRKAKKSNPLNREVKVALASLPDF